ncbi:protein nrt1/ ptr family 5.4 [Quercus suber]|uniref:Protein nrt1/ ptr family 5.4 n=1 Tax=Quercus suber TaxID=58331 RepID=A0AAW0ILA2_QUESU
MLLYQIPFLYTNPELITVVKALVMIHNSHKDTKKQVDSDNKSPHWWWTLPYSSFLNLCSSFSALYNLHFSFLLAVVEVAERFAFFGLAANLITYLTNELHQPISTAAKNVNTWAGVSYIVPLFAAFVADSLFGRFNTILLASVIYLVGMILLTLSVSVVPLDYRKAIFFVALYIIAVGEGGHKPCVQTFAADQFEEDSLEDKKVKSSFFNWWFWGIHFYIIAVGEVAQTSVQTFAADQFEEDSVEDKKPHDNVGWTAGIGMLAKQCSGIDNVLVAAVRKWRVKDKFDNCSVYHGDGLLAPDQPKTSDFGPYKSAEFSSKRDCLLSWLQNADVWTRLVIDNIDSMRTIRILGDYALSHQVEK